MNKRGMAESGTASAAAVILLIGLVIVAYLVLLPEDARKNVLEGKDIDYDEFDNGHVDDDRDDNKDRIILLRNPGTLVPSGKDEIEKKFASVNLFDTSDRQSKKLADRITVSRSLFSNKFEELDFRLDDLEDLESLSLFFNVKESSGSIQIQLNGETVFEGNLESSDVPIELSSLNVDERNRLKISGSSVGAAILSKNQFELRDIEVIQNFNLMNKQELRTFEVARAESLDDARMEFFVNCVEIGGDQGVLKVFLNRRMVFFGRVVCDASQNRFDISEDFFVDGTNRLVFEIDQGNYIIEEVELNYDFDEGVNPLYFFTIDEQDFEDVLDGDEVNLRLSFESNDDRKRADVRINDKTLFVDVNSGSYIKEITEYIREGENFVKIFPKNEFDLIQLEVELERA